MRRRVKLRLAIPPIELESWKSTGVDPLTFSFEYEDIVGVVLVSLDDEAIDWDFYLGVDPATGEQWEGKKAIACHRIIVCIDGDSPETESVDNDKPAASSASGDIFDFLVEPEREDPANVKFLLVARKLAIEYIDRFVYYLRSELGQYWVDLGEVRNWGIWTFLTQTDARWVDDDGIESRIKKPPLFDLVEEENQPGMAFRYNARSLNGFHWLNMQQQLEKAIFPEVTMNLLNNAKNCLMNGDYRMASVEAISALESRLVGFIEKRCKARGISNTAWQGYKREVGITVALKLLLPLVIEQKELESIRDAVNECLKLNSVRNDVVHEGDNPVAKTKVIEKGIEAVQRILEFVRVAEMESP